MGTRADVPEVEPNDTCPGQDMACGDRIIPAELVTDDQDWYTFAGEGGHMVTIALDSHEGSSVDTYLELYAECGGTRIAYDDDGGPGAFSLITGFILPSTGNYYIKVRGYSGSSTGLYQMSLQCVIPPPPPENDTCDGAILLERCSNGVIEGDLTQANNDYSPESGGCTGYTANGKDIVYLLDVQEGDIVDLVYTTPNHDGSMYIITDCSDPAGTCVIGEDDPEPETINWVVPATGIYYYIVDAYSGGGIFVCARRTASVRERRERIPSGGWMTSVQ